MASASRAPLRRAARPRLQDLVDRHEDRSYEISVDSSDSDEENCSSSAEVEDSSSEDSDEEQREDVQIRLEGPFRARNNVVWLSNPPSQVGRRPARHIIREAGGPTRNASTNSIENSLSSFITNEMVDIIIM